MIPQTCNETVLPGDWGQVVIVDITLKLKHFSGLKNKIQKEKETEKVVRCFQKKLSQKIKTKIFFKTKTKIKMQHI